MYSLIIPIHNESESINCLYNELRIVLDSLQEECEIIFIEDGSTDDSFEKINAIMRKDKSVKLLTFPRRQGETFALKKGFELAKGEIIITLDGDLQDFPFEIPRLIEKLNEGYDVVCGWRYHRKDKFVKVVNSKIGNYIFRVLTRIPLHDISCTLRVYRNYCIKALDLNKNGHHRFIPFMMVLKNFKVAEIKVFHRPREYGRSKYSVSSKAFKVAYDFLLLFFKKKKTP